MPTNILVLNKSWVITGAGDPEGVHEGPVGSLFLREDGATGTSVYVKETGSGATGWVSMGAGGPGPAGPPGDPGLASGRVFYYAVTDASDIAGYKTLLTSPSAAAEQAVPVSCSGTSDVLVGAFVTEPGVPGAGDYPAGTAYRRFFARTSAGSARLHLQIYLRTQAGVETLARDEFSDPFTQTTVASVMWLASAPYGGTLGPTDRLVSKVYAQRVSGTPPLTVTVYFEGTTHASQLQTTLVMLTPGHAATHQDGGTDELALDASQVTTGTMASARLPATMPPATHGSSHGSGQPDQIVISGAQITTGTVADARLSANVPLKSVTNTFSGTQIFSGPSNPELDLHETTGNLLLRLLNYQSRFQIYYNPSGMLFGVDLGGNVLAAGALYTPVGVYERNRSTLMGNWIDVPYDPGNFSTSVYGPGAWTVEAGDMITYRYTLIGKTMTVAFYLGPTTIVAPTNGLGIRIPGNQTAASNIVNACIVNDGGTAGVGYCIAGAGSIWIMIHRADGAAFTVSGYSATVLGQITFEVL